MIAQLLATFMTLSPGIQLADNVEGRQASLFEPPQTVVPAIVQGRSLLELPQVDQPRPSLVAPVAMIVGGAALSAGGTGLMMVGVFLSGLKVSCAPGRCDQINVMGNVMLVSGIVVTLAGVITAIVGHVRVSERVKARNAVAMAPMEYTRRSK